MVAWGRIWCKGRRRFEVSFANMDREIWIMHLLHRSVGHVTAAILCLQATARPGHVNAAILCLQVTARPLGHVWEMPTQDQSGSSRSNICETPKSSSNSTPEKVSTFVRAQSFRSKSGTDDTGDPIASPERVNVREQHHCNNVTACEHHS